MSGPLLQLIAQLNHLQSLLKNVPESLPLDPIPLQYSFGLDYKAIVEEGAWFTFNQNMEVNFKVHWITMPFSSA